MEATKEEILQWLSAKHDRSVYLASVHFNMDISRVWFIINERSK